MSLKTINTVSKTMISQITSSILGIFILCYTFNVLGADLTHQKQRKPPEVIEKLKVEYDKGPESLKDLLDPMPKANYQYTPIIKDITLSTEIGTFMQYAINKFSHNHSILNPNAAIGLLWKGWLDTSISGGYGIVTAKTLPESDRSKEYKTSGPFLNFMLGYKYAYSEDNVIGITLEFGGTYYKQYLKSTNYKKDKNTAYWIKLLLDTKSRFFDNTNFFIGTQIGIKLLVRKSKTPKLKKFIIPYYGASTNKIGLTGSLYLHYSIPFYRKFISAF